MRPSSLLFPFYIAIRIAYAQTTPPETDTRESVIEAERSAKAASIQPEKTKSSESGGLAAMKKAFTIWNFTRVGSHGFGLRLGGLPDGSGLAAGPQYVYARGDVYDPDLIWTSYAIASLQGYYRLQSGVELPRLLKDHAFFSATALRFDYPRLAFYGEGPDSRKTGRTDYRMQDDDFEIKAGFKVGKRFRAGVLGSYQRIDLLSGTQHGIAQTLATYNLNEAHGENSNFLAGGFFAQYDGRDEPLDPHAGTYLFSEFQNINGSQKTLGGFNEYDFEGQHYFHYWNKRRVLATRVKAVFTTPHPGSFVPFYLEPRLGGSVDLRGFRPYRFYDQNSVVATAEYRWSATEALDMALFGDAGKVYRNADTFSLAKVQTDIGVGFRAKAGSNVPFRLDVGFSREGVQVWLDFYNVF